VYEALAKSLAFCSAKYDSKIAGYVFMPSHLHLLIFIEGRVLSGFMRDFKKYLAQRAFRELGVFDKNIWEPRFDRVAVETAEVFRIKLEYMNNNPVKAGLVGEAGVWASGPQSMLLLSAWLSVSPHRSGSWVTVVGESSLGQAAFGQG